MISIRPSNFEDKEYIYQYWKNLSVQDIERMGVNGDAIEGFLKQMELRKPKPEPIDKEKTAQTTIWEVNKKPIGFSVLKDFEFGKTGSMHLHMWSSEHRGKGYGPILFCKTALENYRRFQLSKIICEPKKDNKMPNNMLNKIGYTLEKTYFGGSSALSAETTLNSYYICPEISKKYLEEHHFYLA